MKNTEELKYIKKYNLDPDKIKIVGECDFCGNYDKKAFVLENLIYLYELAEKNYFGGNITKTPYAAGVILDDWSIHFGVNYNATRNETSSICAERSAILQAFNDKIQEYEINDNKRSSIKIQYILMSSYKNEFSFANEKMTPCADCLSWFNTGYNLSNKSAVVSLQKDELGEVFILVQKLDEFLPLRNMEFFNIDTDKIYKIIRSENAKNNAVKDNEIIELYRKTYFAYKNNQNTKTSNQNIAAGIISNGEIFTGLKVDFSKRWFIEPLMAACYKAIEKYGANTKIQAVCYAGEEYTIPECKEKIKDGIISLKTLGRISTKFADKNTLVVTGGRDGILINTIGDFMPDEYRFIQNYKIN